MSNNAILQLDEQTLRERYALLCQVCDTTSRGGDLLLEAQLQHLEKLIEHELPALARRGSPDHVADLLHALRMEMVRFREFCAYPELPSKVVVGLGGSFSAGKSSLINALIGDRKCLVTEVDPTTSLPTYLVQGQVEEIAIHAINHFNRKIALTHAQFRTLTHEEKALYGSQVSALLKSVVVAHPALPWSNLALLDTPGYSKADEASSERTDAIVARTQLNSAQFIVWLVPADKGTITEEDIAFLVSLDRTIPKLVVLSRSDKHPPQEIEKIVALVRDTLAKRGIAVLDVIPFSNRPSVTYNAEPLLSYFAEWDKASSELGFAQQFKRQFMAYQEFIDEVRQEAQLRLSKFNRILSLSDDSEVLDDIDSLQHKSKVELAQLEKLADELTELHLRFFTLLKQIGDSVGIPLPEPDTLSLLALKPTNISQPLQDLANEWGLYATTCDYKLWELLNQDLPLTGFDMKVLGNRCEVAQQDEVIRCHYAALLLMVLMDKGAISELQQLMLDRWLPAIGLAGRQAELCILAGRLAQDQLSDAIKQLKQGEDGRLVSSLLLDSILFTRLDKPLAEETIRMLGILAGCAEIDEQKISCLVCLAIDTLGLPTDLLKGSLGKINLSSYQFNLGSGFEMGECVAQDKQQAAVWYRKSAEQGNAEAQCRLGLIQEKGVGIEQDWQQAMVWYRKSAEQGYAEAQRRLGQMYDRMMYDNIEDVVRDSQYTGSYRSKTFEWYKNAAEQATVWYLKAAEQGDVEGQYLYGDIYSRDVNWGPLSLSADWYRKAAEQGHAEAQCRLGLMYENGKGDLAWDLELARGWYRKAAEQGYARAYYLLGDIYKSKDIQQAMVWYHKAIEQGDAHTHYLLGEMYKNGSGVVRNVHQAMDWYLKAAELGDARAQRYLGDIFSSNSRESYDGMMKDDQQAIDWYRKAAKQGDFRAQLCLAKIYGAPQGILSININEGLDDLLAYVWSSVALVNAYYYNVKTCDYERIKVDNEARYDHPWYASRLTPAQLIEAKALVVNYLQLYRSK